jgi:hypothetical protein
VVRFDSFVTPPRFIVSADRTFKTGSCPANPPDIPASGGTVVVRKSGIVILPGNIPCPPGNGKCPVTTITLSGKKASFGASSAKKSKKKILKLGSYKYSIKAGKKGKVKTKLSKKAFRLIKRRHKLKAKVTIIVKHGKATVKRTMKVTFKLKKRK